MIDPYKVDTDAPCIDSYIEKGALWVEGGSKFDRYVWFGSSVYGCKRCGSACETDDEPCPYCSSADEEDEPEDQSEKD